MQKSSKKIQITATLDKSKANTFTRIFLCCVVALNPFASDRACMSMTAGPLKDSREIWLRAVKPNRSGWDYWNVIDLVSGHIPLYLEMGLLVTNQKLYFIFKGWQTHSFRRSSTVSWSSQYMWSRIGIFISIQWKRFRKILIRFRRLGFSIATRWRATRRNSVAPA